ncbi:hypothetical protein [Caldanaerobius polysaccharolyticus]|uniref:hypothetical protein n=1 Tax=Caldanaerobius polysaccharolyticus TaxID=44256 RepID=UPI00054E909A|nr:hypothetical protein [Caldanaerobius polysaccharolyticus]
MTDNIILEGLQKYLIDNVSSKIKLQKPNDNIKDYELVHPAVFIGWLPPKNYLPPGMESEMPCIVVGLDEGTDDGQDASLNIRISFAVFSPGLYDSTGQYTPNFDGYKDLLNLITLTRIELSKSMSIGTAIIEKPFKWGMYEEQPYPYWYGYLTFSISCATMDYVPTIEEQL